MDPAANGNANPAGGNNQLAESNNIQTSANNKNQSQDRRLETNQGDRLAISSQFLTIIRLNN